MVNNLQELFKLNGEVAQSAEAIDLKSIKCGFESRLPYQKILCGQVAQLDRATVF
jgi:hypothetical protein